MSLLFDFLSTAALLFIVTSGLMIIFGVMQVVNFAHGSILTIGAYSAYLISKLGAQELYGWILAFLAGGLIGMVIERCVVRPLYRRPLDAILATWGLGIVIIQLIIMIFGRGVQLVEAPLDGTTELLGISYSSYRLLLIPIALIILGCIFVLLNCTNFGIKTRAVIMNETLAESLGINADRIRLLTFSLGSGLGTLAGMLITPLSSVDPYMGVAWLTNAFMLVMVSGHSFISLMLACLVFGSLQVLISIFINPVIGGMSIAVLAAITLRIRPQGFSRE